MLRLMRFPVAVVAAALLTWTASADVYRWVDEQGQVHYGSQPPRDSANASRYRVEVSSGQGQTAAAEQGSPVNDDGNEGDDRVIKPGDSEGNCRKGREYLQSLQQNREQIFQIPGSDSPRALNDEEYQRELDKAQTIIDQHCE